MLKIKNLRKAALASFISLGLFSASAQNNQFEKIDRSLREGRTKTQSQRVIIDVRRPKRIRKDRTRDGAALLFIDCVQGTLDVWELERKRVLIEL